MYLMLGDNVTYEQAEASAAEYYRVRGQLVELAKYYNLLCVMGGVRHAIEIHMGDAYRAERMKEAQESFSSLWALVRHIDELSSTDDPDDFMALVREWPEVLNALYNYSFDYADVATGVKHRVNERFEDLRMAARYMGVDLWKLEEGVEEQLGRGRPRTSSVIASDPRELWYRGNQVLDHFEGEDPGREAFAREYLRRHSASVHGEHSNPGSSLLRRASSVLERKVDHERLIQFLRAPEPK